ncbi:MAG TPA: hypothetical protein VIJ50_07905 [Solirubrobacteraceae bacterium]
MVSPPYKGGYGANGIKAVAPDGESVAFVSLGAFAGAPTSNVYNGYLASRSDSGWSTVSLLPPTAIAPYAYLEPLIDLSSNLGSSLLFTELGANNGTANYEGTKAEFLLHPTAAPDTTEGFDLVGPVLKTIENKPLKPIYVGASSDFSHVLFQIGGGEDPLLSNGLSAARELYDLSSNEESGSSLHVVGVNAEEQPIDPYCPVELGSSFGKVSQFNAIADGGQEIFFTTNANTSERANCDDARREDPANPGIVYVRLAGQKTLQVSGSLDRSEFDGANELGTEVFFTTRQSLVAGDADSGEDLYMATIGCPGGAVECPVAAREVSSLTQVSHDPTLGEAAEVQGLVRLSPDGSRVYFVARGTLSQEPNAEGLRPERGADNLYVYDSSTAAAPVFVADLCSGSERSGALKDPHCPASVDEENSDVALWATPRPEVQTADNGNFLVFSTYAQLVSNDTDMAKDVYRYNAETGRLDRVSIGEDGYDTNGNNSLFNATIHEDGGGGEHGAAVYELTGMNSRAISEDGSRIVFTTEEPLSPHVVNHVTNAYEWHVEPGWSEGQVSLISSGNATEPVNDVVITPGGRDVYFVTTQGLVPQDIDGAPDIYDARLGGGFPTAPASVEPCSSDACQGPLSTPAPLLVPGSVSQAPGESVSSPPAKHRVKSKAKKAKAKKRSKKAPLKAKNTASHRRKRSLTAADRRTR